MSVRLHAAAGVEDLVDRFAALAGVETRRGSADAFDVAVLAHGDAAALVAGRKAAAELCSDLGRRAPRGPVYTVTIAAGAGSDGARECAHRLHRARVEAGFGGTAIRRATQADAAAARAVVFPILESYGFVPEPEAMDADLFDLEGAFLARGGLFDVATDEEGTVVATCGLQMRGDASAELRKMYVRADCRGHGLGHRLLERAVAFARARGLERIVLETASVLTEAIALYGKAGFVPRPGKPDACRCDRAFELALS